MKVRRKSLWRSANNKRAKKFANMRAAKERKRVERLSIDPTAPDLSHTYTPKITRPLFVVTISCSDGESVRMPIHESAFGLSISATSAGRKVSAILTHYRPVPAL